MKQELTIIDPKEFGIEENKALSITQSFAPKQLELTAFSEQYAAVIKKELNKETFKEARELRLKLVKVRTGIADVHKTEKAFFLASGKFVDALKNKLTLPVEQMEEKLSEIEKYEEKQESARKAKLKTERETAFIPYAFDTSFLPLADMTDEQFNGQLESAKIAFETKQREAAEAERLRVENDAKIEAERIESERIAAEEREKMRIENERLKKEAEARELADKKRRKEEVKKQAAENERLRLEREAQQKAFIEQEEKRISAEKALKEKEADEAKAAAEQQASIERELSKGDADKVKDLISDLKMLKTKYSFKSAKNKKMYVDVSTLLDKVINHIN